MFCEDGVSVHNVAVINCSLMEVFVLKVRAYQCVREYLFLREEPALGVALSLARNYARPAFCWMD
jgi:hypothetical protein